jgi:proteasome lid subunit RPN8/RPN11
MAIRWNDRSCDPLPVLPGHRVAVEILIDAAAESAVMAHLRGCDVEQGGLLIGRAWRGEVRDAPGPVVRVQLTQAVAAQDATGSAFALRMETAVWSAARARLQPGELIVGWYHSHPGLGAFFSQTDRQTQRAVFHHEYSLGWVVDPVLGEEALFLGPDCTPVTRQPPVMGQTESC